MNTDDELLKAKLEEQQLVQQLLALKRGSLRDNTKALNNYQRADRLEASFNPSRPSTNTQVPVSSGEYKIKHGDSLWKISKLTGVPIDELAKYNGISNPNIIREGKSLFIPLRGSKPVEAPQIPQGTPTMQNPRTPMQSPQSGSNESILGLGGLMRKMGQQVDPTVLTTMAGLGGMGTGLANTASKIMPSIMKPNPTRGMGSILQPNPTRGMGSTLQPNPDRMSLENLYRLFNGGT